MAIEESARYLGPPIPVEASPPPPPSRESQELREERDRLVRDFNAEQARASRLEESIRNLEDRINGQDRTQGGASRPDKRGKEF
jgi:uncharacterized coiled-coil DUF342 family protein